MKQFLFVTLGLMLFSCSQNNHSGGDTDSLDDLPTDVDINIDWIRVEPGSFVFGSPETTPCRGAYAEKQVNVTLTRPFRMAATELTQEQWTALGYPNPSQEPQGPDIPVTYVSFYDAAAWCNRLSQIEGLEPCYDLSSCSGTVGTGCPAGSEHGCVEAPDMFSCTGNVHRFEDYSACPGYRLPTTAEWEYAAKAGTTTHTYGGDVGFEAAGSCGPQPSLDDIAWYCYNSGEVIHEVGQKLSNPWGFFDILGNAFEWADYVTDGPPLDESDGHPGEDLIDPTGPPVGTSWDVRGGHYYRTGCEVTPTFQMPQGPYFRSDQFGFRPVQTIFE